MSLRDLINPHIRDLDPYQPGKPIEELERELGITDSIKLASNENPLGASPRALAAVRAELDRVHRYPDGASHDLRNRLADQMGVAGDQLVFGCGADELLELLAKTLLGPGTEVVFAWPSFAMYPIVVRGMGAEPVAVPLDADMVHDLPAMLAAITSRTRLVILCNPNNPTGTSFSAEAFEAFMRELPDEVVLAIDEAYVDFARRADFPDSMAWIGPRPGTIVLRTFSKNYGLAGLRVGYGIADTEFAEYLQRARHPFNVNRLAEVAALAALDDKEHLEKTKASNAEGRAFLKKAFLQMGLEVWPSDANFVLVRSGAGLYEPLLKEGVIVRPLGGFGLHDCVRVSVGTPDENRRLVEVMGRLLKERK